MTSTIQLHEWINFKSTLKIIPEDYVNVFAQFINHQLSELNKNFKL